MGLKVEHLEVEEKGHKIKLEILKDDVSGCTHIMPFRRDCNQLKISFWCLTGMDKYQLLERARNLVRVDLIKVMTVRPV